MAKPRTPVAKAETVGAAVKNPERYANRRSPKGIAPLGAPPTWLSAGGKQAWAQLKAELPWLKESHRGLVEITAMLRGLIIENKGPIALQPMQELRRCYGQLGATPADESKVNTGGDGDEDPDDAFFQKPAAPAKGKPH